MTTRLIRVTWAGRSGTETSYTSAFLLRRPRDVVSIADFCEKIARSLDASFFFFAVTSVPALLAGNAVLYKPSEYATNTGLSIARLLHQAGVPQDVMVCLVGGGEVGQALLQQQIDGDLVPVYVQLLKSTPAEAPALSTIVDPDFNNGPHLSYTVQWLFFSLCAVGGWFALVRREVVKQKQA